MLAILQTGHYYGQFPDRVATLSCSRMLTARQLANCVPGGVCVWAGAGLPPELAGEIAELVNVAPTGAGAGAC